MAEWLYEAGLGENRAALIADGVIVEAAIELPNSLAVGAVVPGRLTHILIPGRRGIVALVDGEALIEPIPPGLTEGATLGVEIVRDALAERGRAKRAKVRATDAAERAGPTLRERIGAATELSPHGPDRLEQAGWSELLEEAATGAIAFDGGALRLSLTPAMNLFDVDGTLDPAALAVAGADAAARAIRRHGIGGSIGIDLPTTPAKAARQAAAAAIDAILPQPFERTAVNGFGFLQIVRRRERASLPELIQSDPAGAAARALLRLAERTPGTGARRLHAHPAVLAQIGGDLQDALTRRTGTAIALRPDPALAISAGHVQADFV